MEPIQTSEEWKLIFDRTNEFLLSAARSVRTGVQSSTPAGDQTLLAHVRNFWAEPVLDDFLRGVLTTYLCLLTFNHPDAVQAAKDIQRLQEYQARTSGNKLATAREELH